MNNVLKKVFSFSVVITTIMWSIGVAALVPSDDAEGATCPTLAAGDMVKVKGKPAIYAVNNNLEILYFPSGDEFKSWRPTYGGYISITQECFDTLDVPATYPGGINYHPGSYIVKRPSSDQLYVVEPNNTLAKITPELAEALYGADYTVMTVADPFWPHYVNRGDDITTAVAHPGMLVKVDGTIYYVDADSSLREVTDTGFTANGFQERFVRELSASAIAGLTGGATIDAEVPAITDKTQSGGVTTSPEATGGNLTVSLSGDTPSGVQAPGATSYNDVLHVTLSASSKAVEVTGVTLQKLGLAVRTDISGTSVWVDGVRYGSIATSLDDNGNVTIGFGNNPIMIAAGSSKVMMVKLNILSGAAATTVGMSLTGVDTNGTVSGLPVLGNMASIVTAEALASYTVATSTVSGYASESTASSVTGQLEIGDTQKEVGKWTFAESGNEDLTIESLTFYIQGTVNDETHLKNWTVYGPDNLARGTTEMSNDRFVTVPVNYKLTKGYSKTLALKVDVADGSNKYFALSIQNDYDVLAKGAAGYYILPGSFDTNGYVPGSGWFKIKQGDVSIQRAATSPSGSISAGSTDVVLAEFDVKALGEALEVRKMALEIEAGQELDADLTGNVKVQSADGSKTYLSRTYSDFITSSSTGDTSFATGTQWDLSTYINLDSLETKSLRVVATVADGATSADSYLVKMGKMYVKRMSTLDYQTKPNATTAYPGNTLTVQAVGLTAAKNTSVGDSTLAAGAGDVVLGSFKLQAGAAEDINVTQMVVDLTTSTWVENIGLYDGDTLLGSEIVSPTTASNTFSVSLTVYKNQVKTINVKGDVKSTAVADDNHVASVSAITAVGASTGESAITSPMNVTLQIMTYGSAELKVTNDSSVENMILLPSATKQLVGISKYEAVNSDITLKKVTYAVRNASNTLEGTAANYGDIELRKADGTVLATAPVVDSGSTSLVTFTGFSYTIDAGDTDKLYLYAEVNDSGVMTPASINTLSIYSDASTAMEAYSGTGLLGRAAIGDSNVAGNDTYFCTSSPMLFHNTAPIIAKHGSSPVGVQTPSSESEIFRFTVNNPGTRDMRINSTTVYISTSGMAGLGTVTSFKLYNGDTLLATESDTTINSSSPTTTIEWGPGNDNSSRMDDFNVSPGDTKTFKVTVNSSNIRTGVDSGNNVYVTASLDGATGYSANNGNGEADWSDGVIEYYYTPVSGSENATEYTASDSYDVNGNTLTY